MSAEQLKNISGGSFSEIASDSEFLHWTLLGRRDVTVYDESAFDFSECYFDYDGITKMIDEVVGAWADAGIRCEFRSLVGNRYFNLKDGKEMTREEAMNYVKKSIRRFPRRPRHH